MVTWSEEIDTVSATSSATAQPAGTRPPGYVVTLLRQSIARMATAHVVYVADAWRWLYLQANA